MNDLQYEITLSCITPAIYSPSTEPQQMMGMMRTQVTEFLKLATACEDSPFYGQTTCSQHRFQGTKCLICSIFDEERSKERWHIRHDDLLCTPIDAKSNSNILAVDRTSAPFGPSKADINPPILPIGFRIMIKVEGPFSVLEEKLFTSCLDSLQRTGIRLGRGAKLGYGRCQLEYKKISSME